MNGLSKIESTQTLEMEIKEFACGLPYWARFISSEILIGNTISDDEIDKAFSFLLQSLKLIEETKNPEISLICNPNTLGDFKEDVIFDTLRNIEGVNALIEKQTLEFSPSLTIIYRSNGAGKSGYVRLLKNAFYSKDKEQIIENINLTAGHKPVYAELDFVSGNEPIPLIYPDNSNNGVFNQFAVFDGEIGRKHLSNRNDFSFRPAGLSLFADFNSALERLQNKLSSEIYARPINNPFSDDELFQGESEIKNFLSTLSHNSKLKILKKNLPFTEEDKKRKTKIDKEYDDLKIALSQKDNALKKLEEIKTQLANKKKKLEKINISLSQKSIDSAFDSISDYNAKQAAIKKEGAEKFRTDKIKSVGSSEWKQFVEAAEKFALKQKRDKNITYPDIGDHCLLCQQPINDETYRKLILSYWVFVKSVVEQEAKTAKENLDTIKKDFEELDLSQFSETETLTAWLKENHTDLLVKLTQTLLNQQTLLTNIIADIDTKSANKRITVQLDMNQIDEIDQAIDAQIKVFEEDEQKKILTELLKKKNYLAHKEKLQQRITEIENLYQNMIWVNKAKKFNKQRWKTLSTKTEKRLSIKYFNEEYIRTFNQECINLDGNFGIDIDAKSFDGQSNRQLFLKGRNPSAILSEGEQKVISLADFIAETNLSIMNKGIIFDDPVNSLDDDRKSVIADRLVAIARNKQVIVFTHDLVFVSSLINGSSESGNAYQCHWIESSGNVPGRIWLNNTPSFEKKYKKSGLAQKYYVKAKNAPPEEREAFVKIGFAALRSTYEAFVIFDLFAGVVQRFSDRVSIDSLSDVYVDRTIVEEISKNFGLACRYMEGHSHSDKFLSKKPTPQQLNEEIRRFDNLKKKIKELKNS